MRKVRHVREKCEIWEKVRCARKSEKKCEKSEVYEEKVREVWEKVRKV